MASLAKFFRSAARHTPHLRPALPTAAGAARIQAFSSSSSFQAEHDEEEDAPKDFVELTGYVVQAAEEGATHTGTQTRFKNFGYSSFVQPVDLSRGARVDTGFTRRSKRPLLGPGRREAEKNDVFRQLDIDPVHEATNSKLMSYFVTEMGKIKPRAMTGLTWKSQRKLGKAIRRARMMGIIPQLSRKVLGKPSYHNTVRSVRSA
ncbi:ribosomal protein S18 [Cytidiella melzeri]|nr:ribosomal protein S18 [Cytidiella melzeri]